MSKEYKKGIKKALDILKDCQRWNMHWEWMEIEKDGEYICFDDMYKKLIEEVKSDNG